VGTEGRCRPSITGHALHGEIFKRQNSKRQTNLKK
jgi:hypothetical protein